MMKTVIQLAPEPAAPNSRPWWLEFLEAQFLAQTGSDPVFVVTEVSPADAEYCLAHMRSNRILRLGHVLSLAQDMSEDHWYFTHQGIAFTADGELGDGQHRLRALIRTGRSQKMLVAFGLSEAALDAVDGGQKRLVRDVFRIHNVANSSVTGAAIRLLVGYEDSGGIEAHRPSYVTSGPKAMAALERHLGILDFPAPRSTPNGLLSPAAILWLRYETDKIDSDFALKFWDWVLLGQGPGINEIPMANVLRRRLESLYDSRSGEGRAWIRLRLAIRAWNAARAGETLTKIQTPTGLIRISGRVEPETMADEPDDLDDLDEAEEPTPVRPAYVESLFG